MKSGYLFVSAMGKAGCLGVVATFAIMATEDARSAACDDTTTTNPLTECRGRRFVYTINGRAWPRTERVHATVGDSLHWRVINVSGQLHPMHLHGFYYRVDARGDGFADTLYSSAARRLVVTELLRPLTTMAVTWV